jgi:hypothetical protein
MSQTCMHHQSAHRVVAHAPLCITARVDRAQHANTLVALAFPGKFGRVVPYGWWSVCAPATRSKSAIQRFSLVGTDLKSDLA